MGFPNKVQYFGRFMQAGQIGNVGKIFDRFWEWSRYTHRCLRRSGTKAVGSEGARSLGGSGVFLRSVDNTVDSFRDSVLLYQCSLPKS